MDVEIDNMCLICCSYTFHIRQTRVRYNCMVSKQECARDSNSHMKLRGVYI